MPTFDKKLTNLIDEELSISEQQSYYVAKANELIQLSRFSLSVQQYKLLLYMISKIKPDDKGEQVYVASLKDFCKVCGISSQSGKTYIEAKASIKNLADKSIWLQKENKDEILLRWLNRVRYNAESGSFEYTFHQDMLPYLYDLQSRYTRYRLDNVLTLRSKYGIRLYEVLKSYQHMRTPIRFTIEELRARLDASSSYPRIPDFRRFVIEKAVDDINACSDIIVEYYPWKSENSRATDSFIFVVKKPNHTEATQREIERIKRLSSSTNAALERKRRRYEEEQDPAAQKPADEITLF